MRPAARTAGRRTLLIALTAVGTAGLDVLDVPSPALFAGLVVEGYLATTPGGIYAVLATAISAGVDVAFVVAVQVLRVIVMLLVAPAVARWVGRRS